MSLPANFEISERVKAWAEAKGFGDLEAHLEHFVGWARASGRAYVDWDQAFMNAIRDDWAKRRPPGGAAPADLTKLIRELEEEEKKRAAD